MEKVDIIGRDGVPIHSITIGFDDSSIKAVIIICHGFGEHAGCYVELAEKLHEHGYASIIHNQRGHGLPPGSAKNRRGRIHGYQYFMDDVAFLTEYARKTLPGTPIALYGHSMGGNIVINTLLRMPKEQASDYICTILEAPWLDLYRHLNIFDVLSFRVLNIVMPWREVAHRLRQGNLPIDNEESFVPDGEQPLYYGFISVRMSVGISDAGDYALKHAARLPVKAFLAKASDDTVVCNKAIDEFAAKAGGMVTCKQYESKHAIHNDSSRDKYISDVIDYLDEGVSH